jgi:hypothetical protein
MPKPEHKTSLINGALFPSKADYESIIARVHADIKSNTAVAARFKADPRSVLATYGLNEDVQNEALRSMKLITSDWCIITCITSCWFTHVLD